MPRPRPRGVVVVVEDRSVVELEEVEEVEVPDVEEDSEAAVEAQVRSSVQYTLVRTFLLPRKAL